MSSNFAGEKWDKLNRLLKGSIITKVLFKENYSVITFKRGVNTHILEVPKNKKLLPTYGGNGKFRKWNSTEDLRNAWVVTIHDLWIDD